MSDVKILIFGENNSKYEIERFTEYEVDLDLDMDADQFTMVIENPYGIYTGIINKFDDVELYINNIPLLAGSIDECEYIWDANSNQIKITGRDILGVLIDNDALPGTKYNIDIKKYLADKCNEYGIKYHKISGASICKKLIIGSSESELSVAYNIITADNKKIWSDFKTLYQGDWDMDASPSYKFMRGDDGKLDDGFVPIVSLSLRDSGVNMRSEYRLYGSMNDGAEKVVGTATNPYLIKRGIKKRKTFRTSNNDSASKYASSALRHIQEDFQNDILLKITVPVKDAYKPNRTAIVKDDITGINGTYFIKNVTYRKDNSGTHATITMIPDQKTFNVIWSTSKVAKKSTTSTATYNAYGGQSLGSLLGK